MKVLSFRNAYGGVLGLGERIEKLEASKATGESVPVRKLAPGEFQTAESVTRFSYDVILMNRLDLRRCPTSHG